ncbi:MAG: septum formation protein Maf [Bacteroidetes bacterium SW_9_63_38]|nr:MAG: septum formation protein Maf [Bacteroidetes bacterium SW_9_63_38]
MMSSLLSFRAPFILASQSPRRRALLEQVHASFSVEVSPADETLAEPGPPPETAQALADKKATPVAQAHPDALVLAADTIVIHDGTILEKPNSAEEAAAMLHRLSDTTHSVYTGLALHHSSSDRAVTVGEETRVSFAPLRTEDIDAYVASGSPMDKAGGYGIQDHTAPFFVERLHGDYYNVVGLPLRRLYTTLWDEFGDLLT